MHVEVPEKLRPLPKAPRPAAVIAVGDCDPAARAINAASSGVPQMAHIIRAMRGITEQWLGVQVPREWNLDADRLSHPRQLARVQADAAERGIRTSQAFIPNETWNVLRAAITRPGGDAVFGGGGLGVLDTGASSS